MPRTCPRPEHPRPDFERAEFENLNGSWQFAFDDASVGLTEKWYAPGHVLDRKITVPFAYQSEASGIGGDEIHPHLWYRRSFTLSEEKIKKRTLLHFGAVDFRCNVYVNGHMAGGHTGGYTPFTLDVSPYVTLGENDLCCFVEDLPDPTQPRGKQYWHRGLMGCWYTPVSGIWQTVYLEWVGKAALKKIHITPDIDHHNALFEMALDHLPQGKTQAEVSIDYKGEPVARITQDVLQRQYRLTADVFQLCHGQLDPVHLWWPSDPRLYDVKVRIFVDGELSDEVSTYFGMRKVEVVKGQVLLNNEPLYQRLILDQGYWPDTLLTPPSDEAIQEDIKLTLRLGFNGARKHQKIEDPRYYYWADKLGLLVWGEVPSPYEYTAETVRNLEDTLLEFIHRDFNHPCIITWTTMNESWGVRQIYANKRQQACARALYEAAYAVDGSRPVSSNDGWEQVKTDICALHDYTDSYAGIRKHFGDRKTVEETACHRRMCYAQGQKPTEEEAFLVTEYGGIAFEDPGLQRIGEMETWGYYGKVTTQDEFFQRFQGVTDAIREIPYCRGWCYTQLTDVMQETNGLLTPDRKPKMDVERFRQLNRNPEGVE